MTSIAFTTHDKIPIGYSFLGMHDTKEEAIKFYEAWKKSKPNNPYLISAGDFKGEIYYAVWTKKPKNAKKMGRVRK